MRLCRRTASGADLFDELVKESDLSWIDLAASGWDVKPLGTVDLGELLHLAGLRRPFHLKGVGLKILRVEVAFDRVRMNDLSRLLCDRL